MCVHEVLVVCVRVCVCVCVCGGLEKIRERTGNLWTEDLHRDEFQGEGRTPVET